jgi:hypothetical protein
MVFIFNLHPEACLDTILVIIITIVTTLWPDYRHFVWSFCHALAARRAGGIQDIPPTLLIDTTVENIKFKV